MRGAGGGGGLRWEIRCARLGGPNYELGVRAIIVVSRCIVTIERGQGLEILPVAQACRCLRGSIFWIFGHSLDRRFSSQCAPRVQSDGSDHGTLGARIYGCACWPCCSRRQPFSYRVSWSGDCRTSDQQRPVSEECAGDAGARAVAIGVVI